MRRLFIIPVVSLFLFAAACKTGKPKKDAPEEKTEAQKIFDEIDDIHIQGMSKMAKLSKLRQQVTSVIDSAVAGSKKLAADYRQQLDSSLQNLADAEATMDKWMTDFYRNMDTLSENMPERIRYLTAEKIKAGNLRDAILNSIQWADSLLHKKD